MTVGGMCPNEEDIIYICMNEERRRGLNIVNRYKGIENSGFPRWTRKPFQKNNKRGE